MKSRKMKHGKRNTTIFLASVLLGSSLAAHADEREDLEKVRETVLSLIDALVKNHILPREKADALMREAQLRANTRLAQAPVPDLSADGKKIVRVPYVPEAVRVQMHDQIKAEILAETRMQQPAGYDQDNWLSRFKFEGDVRLREDFIRLGAGNTPATTYAAYAGTESLTRVSDIIGSTPFNYNYNTQQNVDRLRLRARLGATVKVADNVTAGLTIATGSSTAGPTSTNQTLGQGSSGSPGFFNKDALVLDRAYIKYEPLSWLSLSGGRIRNPFVATDLVWADDLNFDGVAMTVKPQLKTFIANMPDTFITAGWFPLTTGVPNQTASRSLFALQGGADWQLGMADNHVKLAAGLYDYHNISGQSQSDTSYANYLSGSNPSYLSSAYGSAYAQHGNTLFCINAPTDNTNCTWGLASAFRELDLTGSVDIAQFEPVHVVLSGDFVKNLAFSRADMQARTGNTIGTILDGKAIGYMGKIQVGAPKIVQRGDWNAYFSYRYLGSDAVLDAFTSSDFGLGGTNSRGTVLGFNYGLEKNTWLSLRWMSSDLIDSMVPSTSAVSVPSKYSTDLIQLDLNVRF